MDKTAPAMHADKPSNQLNIRTTHQIPPVKGGGVKDTNLDGVILCPHTGHESLPFSDMEYFAFNQDLLTFFLLPVVFSLLLHNGFFIAPSLHGAATVSF